MTQERDFEDGGWHMDRKLNVGTIVALVLQFIGFVIVGTAWKSAVDSKLDYLERANARLEDSDKSSVNRLTIVEQRFIAIQDSLTEIKQDVKSLKGKP